MRTLRSISFAASKFRFFVGVLGSIAFLAFILPLASCGGSDHSPAGDRQYAVLALDMAYSVPFSYLSGIRELSDGRILAADPTSQVLLRIDLETGSATLKADLGMGGITGFAASLGM